MLRGMGRARRRSHRYTRWRWGLGALLTLVIGAIPLLGILRLDLLGGRHVVLGREVGLVEAAKAFAFPFLAVNVGIVVASRFVGRYLCGFGCPYGALSRLQEWLRSSARTGGEKLRGKLALLGVVLLLSAIAFSWFVDWRVFTDGSLGARAVAGTALGLTVVVFYSTVRFVGLRFCRDWCPSGVYFALLGHETFNGVEFAHPETCTDCKACEAVCPVDLNPREMSGGAGRGERGFYPEGLSNFSNCIRCGDCVLACDGINVRAPGSEPVSLRMGWLPPEARTVGPSGSGDDAPRANQPAGSDPEPAAEAEREGGRADLD